MKIGFIVEGSSDRAFLTGLHDRWCEYSPLQPLGYRGSIPNPRQYPKICKEGRLKGCDLVVLLFDSDTDDLNAAYAAGKSYLDAEVEYYVVLGIPVRNIECWICANPEYIASHYPCDPNDLRAPDPKSAFEKALGITNYDRKEEEIAALVREYPSLKPLIQRTSFKRFYDDAMDFAQQNNCQIPNEWET